MPSRRCIVEAWGYDQRLAVERATLRIGAFEIAAVAVGVERPDVAERLPGRAAAVAVRPHERALFAGVVGPLEPGRHPLELELDAGERRRGVGGHTARSSVASASGSADRRRLATSRWRS